MQRCSFAFCNFSFRVNFTESSVVFFVFSTICHFFARLGFFFQKKTNLSFTAMFQRVLPKKQGSFSREGQNYHKIQFPLDILWEKIWGQNAYPRMSIILAIFMEQVSNFFWENKSEFVVQKKNLDKKNQKWQKYLGLKF